MRNIVEEPMENFQDCEEKPELISQAQYTLDFLQYILIILEVAGILIFAISAMSGRGDATMPIIRCIIRIAFICFIFNLIEKGHKGAAFVPLIFAVLSLGSSFSLLDDIEIGFNLLNIILVVYCALYPLINIVVMGFIVFSKKISFYCAYNLYNKYENLKINQKAAFLSINHRKAA